MKHISVLKDEVLEAFAHLEREANPLVLDLTLGFGGHTLALLQSHPHVRVIGVDRDAHALELAKERLGAHKGRVEFVQSDFGSVWARLDNEDKACVRAVLADIGVSSMQLDSAQRGFGFASHTLDMRMDTSMPLSAKEVLNAYSPTQLEKIFSEYGEIRETKKLVRGIVQRREREPFGSAREFSELCARTLTRTKGINPATQAFQAIRIEVNDELKPLYNTTINSIKALKPEGRLCIITFHSLEDRIVKKAMQDASGKCICPPGLPYCMCGAKDYGNIITKKPILPDNKEIQDNTRSKSAKLRIFERNSKDFN